MYFLLCQNYYNKFFVIDIIICLRSDGCQKNVKAIMYSIYRWIRWKKKKWCVTSERMKLLMRVDELVADAVKHKLKSSKISGCGIKRRNNKQKNRKRNITYMCKKKHVNIFKLQTGDSISESGNKCPVLVYLQNQELFCFLDRRWEIFGIH